MEEEKVNPKIFLCRLKTVTVLVFIGMFCIFPSILASTNMAQIRDSNTIDNDNLQPSISGTTLYPVTGELIGTGQSLNLTHFANCTDLNVPFTFSNGSWDSHDIPLGENWQGQILDAQITSLTDERNWINGSFDWAEKDDGTNGNLEDDTTDIQNPFQNWTFQKEDTHHISTFYNNNLAGNFFNSSWASTEGRNALELRITGDLNDTDYLGFGYDEHDYCQWTTNFSIARGNVYDAQVKVQTKCNKTMFVPLFQFQVLIDNQPIYFISIPQLLNYGYGWHELTIPMSAWVNNTPLFTSELDGNYHNISFRLEHTSVTSVEYDFNNRSYQQMFFTNPQLIMRTEVKPSQIGLSMNDIPVESSAQYGVGEVHQIYPWTGSTAKANFTAINNYSYGVDFNANCTLYANKTGPTTNFEPHSDAIGAKFTSKNNSASVWDFYSYLSIPGAYEESNLTINYPTDWQITWAATPQAWETNRLGECFTPSLGILDIPIKQLAGGKDPMGFWKFHATAPNYVLQAVTARNITRVPGSGDYIQSQTYSAGDYLNITAQINTTAAFTDLTGTQASLDIIFPNGTLWSTRTALEPVDSLGFVQFTPFKIPAMGGDYVAGDYQVFVTWNNSKGGVAVNETGLYQTSLRVVHPARLVPKVSIIENFVEGTTTVLKVQFTDEVSGRAIQGASLSFTNLTGGLQIFQEDPSGFYMAELMAPSTAIGEHTITIIANHQYFESESIPLTVIVVPRPSEIQWWLIILFAAVVTAILVSFVAYQRVYRYPKLVRDIRAVKRSIGRGELASMPVKPMPALLAQEYQSQLKEGQGVAKHVSIDALLTTCQQEISQAKAIRPAPAFEKIPPSTEQGPKAGERPPVGLPSQESSSQQARLDQLKNMIAQVEDYKKRVAENEALKKQIAESEKRLHDLGKVAVPTDQLRNKIQELEQKLNSQKVPLKQLQEENQQEEVLRAAANRLPDLQAKVKALEQEVIQAKQAKNESQKAMVAPIHADLPRLAQELQQKLNQAQLALRNRQARIKQLETQLGQTQGATTGKP